MSVGSIQIIPIIRGGMLLSLNNFICIKNKCGVQIKAIESRHGKNIIE